jgi:hypothetical protein
LKSKKILKKIFIILFFEKKFYKKLFRWKNFLIQKNFIKKFFRPRKKKIYFFFSTNRHRSPIRFGSPITMVLIHHWRRELRGRGSLKIRWDDSIHKSIFKTIVQASEKFWNLPFAHKTRRGFDIIERTGAFFSRIFSRQRFLSRR